MSPLLVPAGTRVVTRIPVPLARSVAPAGAVGVVVDVPLDATHSYRVRFMDGHEASLRREEFGVLRRERDDLACPGAALDEHELRGRVVLTVVVGSQAFGLAREDSDVDRRGVYLAPTDAVLSLFGVPEQIEDPARQECHWELQKFLLLALKANPNVLECLYSPLVEFSTPLGDELRAMRRAFVSKLVYQTYNGYVASQFKKMEQRRRQGLEPKWKHAMHLLRLLSSGVAVLETGEVPVDVGARRDEFLAIRDGLVPWDEIEVRRVALHRAFDAAFVASPLPERPDYERANAFLLRARKAAP